MAVYYKFKSERDYGSFPMDGSYMSVGSLKETIFSLKHLGSGTDIDLQVTNAQTSEEYSDETMLIAKNTFVLIRRIPRWTGRTIVLEKEPKFQETPMKEIGLQGVETSDEDEFGRDLYDIPEAPSKQSLPDVVVTVPQSLPDVVATDKADEESRIKALIETPASDWQGWKGSDDRRGFGLERRTPPQGYVCHRCNVPGHFIKYCPTNGDPKYDVKRFKHPTGIPQSMLVAASDGSYTLPSGATAVLRPDEAAFEKEMEGLSSTGSGSGSISHGNIPPELHCPLCKEVMKAAVFTSKCCYRSFCDKCIRDHIISKAMCVCGVKNILGDDLLPNMTLRDTINRILESGNTNSSAENTGSTIQVQDMESARCPLQPKVPSPPNSSASKGEQKPLHGELVTPVAKAPNVYMNMKETASQGNPPLVETGKKKKKKKDGIPTNDLQWRISQDVAAEGYMMPPFGPSWTGMQYMTPLAGAMPYMYPFGAQGGHVASMKSKSISVRTTHPKSQPSPAHPSKRKSTHSDCDYYDHEWECHRHHPSGSDKHTPTTPATLTEATKRHKGSVVVFQ